MIILPIIPVWTPQLPFFDPKTEFLHKIRNFKKPPVDQCMLCPVLLKFEFRERMIFDCGNVSMD